MNSAPSIFTIGADGVDAEKIVTGIRETVNRKMAQGLYRDARIARAEKLNLNALRDDEQFFAFYLDCLRQAAYVDINDFPITERRRFGARFWVFVKTATWKLLKFYTFRLWSQQNELNALLVTTVEGLDEKYRNKIAALERRIHLLEQEKGACREPNV